LMCRGMGKPCVVGTQIQADESRREIVLKTGARIRENVPVLLDGTNGVLAFSDSPDLWQNTPSFGMKAKFAKLCCAPFRTCPQTTLLGISQLRNRDTLRF
jgi:hypothetical protein